MFSVSQQLLSNAMALHLPEFTVNLKAATQDIKALFAKLKPQWNPNEIIVETVSGGYSCLTSRVHLENDVNDAFTVRVKRLFHYTVNSFVDPNFEVKIVQELSKIGLFPPVVAVFQNGFCYQYIRGKPIINPTLPETAGRTDFDMTAIRAMVEKLAEINSVKLESEDYSKTDFFIRLENVLQNDYKTTSSVDKTSLQKELNELLVYTEKFDLRVTLCHGDPHPGNVIYNKETGTVTFVDWEISHIGYQAYDVAHCLRLLTFQDIVPFPGFPEFPDEKLKDNFKMDLLRCYFNKWSQLNSINVDEAEFNEFCRQVGFFELIWHLTFITLIGSFTPDVSSEDIVEMPIKAQVMLTKAFENYLRVKEKRLHDLHLK